MDNEMENTSLENLQVIKRMAESLYEMPSYKPQLLNTQYFRDSTRKIDFVLVYSDNDLTVAANRLKFLDNVVLDGLEIEIEESLVQNLNLFYVKIHVPDNTLRELVKIYNINLKTNKHYEKPRPLTHWSIYFHTVLTHVQVNGDFLLDQYKEEFTSAERSLIVYNVLINTSFGKKKDQMGLDKCIRNNIFSTAFPLHDGTTEWPDDPNTKATIRQLLMKYWANYKMCLRMQPLDLIEEYFGDETAIFFAWLNFYNRWMFYACILSILWLFATFIQYDFIDHNQSYELCNSKKILCPYCLHQHYCNFIHLKDWCAYSRWANIIDNDTTVIFTFFFTIWGICLMKFWNRHMKVYTYRWKLKELELNTSLREAYIRTLRLRFLIFATTLQRYLRSITKCFRFFISYSIMTSMVLALLIVMVALTLYRLYMKSYLSLNDNPKIRNFSQIILIFSASTLSVISTIALELIYDKMALILTEFECPRTQYQFDQSYIIKKFAFSFLCYFTPIFYLAFFKGQFYTYPGDEEMQKNLIKSDQCAPTGCFLELQIQMATTLIIRHSVMFGKQIILPKLRVWWYNVKVYSQNSKMLPRWEQDYQLHPWRRFDLTYVMQDFVLQYAFVLLFIVSFPMAPLIAFGFNLLNIRFNAHTILTLYHRPISRNYSGLGMWHNILQGITFLAFCTNGFTIALTTQFIPRAFYNVYNKDKKGFLNFTLSEFLISDYGDINVKLPPEAKNLTSCYFMAFRVNPKFRRRYKFKALHWNIFTIRLLFAIFFEHILLLITAIIFYFIPNIPRELRKEIEEEQNLEEQYFLQQNLHKWLMPTRRKRKCCCTQQ